MTDLNTSVEPVVDDKYITICCAYLDLKAALVALQGKDADLTARIERTLSDMDSTFSEYDLPCLRTICI